MSLYSIKILQDFFTLEVKFTKWFFGKAHKNKVIPPKYHCLFDEVVQIESKLPKKKRFGKK